MFEYIYNLLNWFNNPIHLASLWVILWLRACMSSKKRKEKSD